MAEPIDRSYGTSKRQRQLIRNKSKISGYRVTNHQLARARRACEGENRADRQRNVSDGESSVATLGQSHPPAISVPKGGGAIRGIGEKFATNPVTGTGFLSVPIFTTPGRSGFGPQLSLSYDSGSGNGPFGFGWSLSLPSITRKTDKGLPRYQDSDESDVFILSGAEDLVPVLVNQSGQWQREEFDRTLPDGSTFTVERYRPRIEGLFARIERWTNKQTGVIHWLSISRDNITTTYGKNSNARITDPIDKSRVFSWLISESYDDRGNAIIYGYKAEDSANVDPSQAHEKNRSDLTRSANRYLKYVRYGNRTPRQSDEDLTQRTDWLFEVVFDYGEHELDSPTPQEARPWGIRQDTFSAYRAGFEVRTYRLCRRVLMFHQFPSELGTDDYLVRSTEFTYDQCPIASFLTGITQSDYVRKTDGTYLKKSLPLLEFEYSKPEIKEDIREIDDISLENLPSGLDGKRYQWVDLDGQIDRSILIAKDEVLTWHPSTAEQGFGPPLEVRKPYDEEKGPKLIFADGTQSIYLADMSGDGLTDVARIRNGDVCYWPNMGYGRFGSKVAMDNAPWFDSPDEFDQQRIRLADIDGSGETDIIYLGRDGVHLFFNQSGNSWSEGQKLTQFPRVDNLTAVAVVDLLGNGTPCIVWPSTFPDDERQRMRYIDLIGGQKPHLLVTVKKNMGAETRIQYAPSTKFYLADLAAGKTWITRLPFPVHVVERVEIYDRISRNRFVTRYAYHHGYFDGIEREFRGFGMVEQWDTEEFAALNVNDTFPAGDKIDEASHIPPLLTKTWFHTGACPDGSHISRQFEDQYYREPGLTDSQQRAMLLSDTMLPTGLSTQEAYEAIRALKGSILRQEIYALDGSPQSGHPYSVSEHNYTIVLIQPRGKNRHAVFLAHPRETIDYHYERNPTDPRISHALTLEVDAFGNVLKSAAIGYGRRQRDMALTAIEQAKQMRTLITYTENSFTNTIDTDNDYRTPLRCETQTYELTGLIPPVGTVRFSFDEVLNAVSAAASIAYEATPSPGLLQKRLIEHVGIDRSKGWGQVG